MEHTSLIDDAEFWLPPEFLTDEDVLVEKENNGGGFDEYNKCLPPYETRHGFGSFGFSTTVKPRVRSSEIEDDEENFLAGLTRQMVQSTLEDDFPGNYVLPAGNHSKGCGMTRSPQSTLCEAGVGCVCRNQRSNQKCQSRFSSQAAWDMYCTAAEEMAVMNITKDSYDCNNHSGRGLLDLPRNHYFTAAKNINNGSGYYNHEPLPYQKLQAIQFQQLKQQQFLKHHRQLVQQSRGVRVNSNKNGGPVNLLSSAWPNQLPPPRGNSGMRAVFLGDHAGKRGSIGTGVFLPRRANHTSPATAETRKSTLATVFVPARVAQVLNLNESTLEPLVRSSRNLNDESWRQRSNNVGFSSQLQGGVKAEQSVNEPRLPSDWDY